MRAVPTRRQKFQINLVIPFESLHVLEDKKIEIHRIDPMLKWDHYAKDQPINKSRICCVHFFITMLLLSRFRGNAKNSVGD